jgi:hypothetical protein
MTDYSKFHIAESFRHLPTHHGLVDDISTGFSSIRYRGKQWTLQHAGKTYPFRRDDDGTPLSYIDVIVLGISQGTSKAYFGDEAWSEDSASGPICTSRKGDVPDPGTPVPQSKSCGTCSHNEWITKPGGGRGKECQDHKRLAILLMPTMTKKMFNGTALVEPVHLKIPPGSFRSMKAYFDELSDQGFPYQAIVTRVSFSSDRLFEMSFAMIQALTNAEAKVVLPLMDNPTTKQILGGVILRIEKKPAEPVREDTGLMEAFGGAAAPVEEHVNPVEAPKSRGGRPAGAKNKPKLVETIENAPAVNQPAPPPAMTEEGGDWDSSDDELDQTVVNLLNKTNNMLK